jgi:hypothetical protein
LGICYVIGQQLLAQALIHNCVFKTNQTELNEEQKKELRDLTKQMSLGKQLSIFPLTYDSLFEVYRFAPIAERQALKIEEFAKSIGFESLKIAKNFPSTYSGYSVCVSLKFTKQISLSNSTNKEKPSQFFIINPKKDTLLIGNEGTKLKFKAGCLLTNNEVKVELKEYYTLKDYLNSNLPTSSNGKLIETGGVIYLNAKENTPSQKQVAINPNMGIQVDFSKDEGKANMQIFIKDPKSKNQTNWILPNNSTEDWQMTESTYDNNGNIVSSKTYHSKAEWEIRLKEREAEIKKKEEIEQQKAIAKVDEVNKLAANNGQDKADAFLQVNQFGLINCDRFMDEKLVPLALDIDPKYNAKYYMVFSDIRSVLNGELTSNEVVNFESLPYKRKASIVAIGYIDKQAYFYSTDITIGALFNTKIELKPVEETYINEQLAQMGWN